MTRIGEKTEICFLLDLTLYHPEILKNHNQEDILFIKLLIISLSFRFTYSFLKKYNE